MPKAINNNTDTPVGGVSVVARPKKAAKKFEKKTLLWMALPAFLIYAFLYLYPALSNLLYATQKWDGITTPEFTGFRNMQFLLTQDDLFRKALGNNLRFMLVVVILQTGFSLLFATFLLKNSKTNIALRIIYFFPTILSSVSVGIIWTFLYDPNYGSINAVIKAVGLGEFAPLWLGDEKLSLYSIALTQVWFHTGQMIVIYVAGLQQIPKELYEAAEMDGASRWQQFKGVTWPMALPTTAVVVAYTTIQTFRAFDLIFAMTGGGPLYSSEILVTLIYNTAFVSQKFGYASAQSIVLVVLVLFITWLQRKTLRLKDGAQ
jgi:raffinose/stachyose/melibiose transport system permease protein|uniref:carbohydrate ABC transporter permease n=1 Tax=Candidatus Planktophila sp. TaxID=2175601 RepID=UPI004049B5A0